MRLRGLRMPTILVVTACCGWAVVQGIDIVWFQIDAQRTAAGDRRGDGLQAWAGTTGLASLALQAGSRAQVDFADVNRLQQRHDRLAALLAVRPAAARSWIALAELRHALQQPPARVASAFQMSALTGPNEAGTMYQRALFGLLRWENSVPALRARAVVDFCGLTVFDPSQFRIVLATKTGDVRAQIRDRLTDHGCAARLVTAIGL